MGSDLLLSVTDLPRRWILRGVAALFVVTMLVSAIGATVAYDPVTVGSGNVAQPANGSTLVAVQGFHIEGQQSKKKPARLFMFNETANRTWKYNGSGVLSNWFYDADPLPDGDILAVNTIRENGHAKTLVYELDPETKRRMMPGTNRNGSIKFNISDTHDVELINGDQLLVANMREGYNDKVFIYNVTTDRFDWIWRFRNHYPRSTDGGVKKDWTHVNDVDKIGPGKYMLSPRNFDQVIVVDRETKNITLRLGEDDAHDILDEQHNPAYLETEDGKPVFLVADSENDRVVEYTCFNRSGATCDWERTWEVGTNGSLNWPRDANRLPNGNTLITDSLNHRVIEVTPEGEVVWEAYAPWAPFSAHRIAYGNENVTSPTMHDLGVEGSYAISNSTGGTFPQWVHATFGGAPVIGDPAGEFADLWAGATPWIRPVWMGSWGLAYLTFGTLLVLVWGGAELVYQRRRIADRVRTVTARAR